MRRALAAIIAVLFVVAGTVLALDDRTDPGPLVTWTMIDATVDGLQGDAHLVEGGGRRVLVDTGFEEATRAKVVPFLRHRGVGALDAVVVTHAHLDHYGGLETLLEAGIRIGEVRFQTADPAACALPEPQGCDLADVERIRRVVTGRGVPFVEAEPGDGYRFGDGARLVVVHAFDGVDTPVGPTDVNDTSLIMRLDAGDVSVLFTGDLNEKLGAWLADHPVALRRVRLLKVPHHAAESLAPDAFFESVAPHAAFVPGPVEVWCDERADRVRAWLEAAGIPHYVNGHHGHVTVALGPGDRVDVATERPGGDC